VRDPLIYGCFHVQLQIYTPPSRRLQFVIVVNRRDERAVSDGMRYAPKLSTRSRRKR
jgi:hypothetical protein